MSGFYTRQYVLLEFFKTVDRPGRLIISDDPMRVKMLAAHHLEYAALMFEDSDELLYFGSYNGIDIALAAAGFGSGAVPEFARRVSESGVEEIIYIGGCAAITDRYALRTVVLADGGSRSLLNRALTTAARYGIPVVTRTVLPPGGVTGECVDITESITGSLYKQAQDDGVKALSVLTVSENTKSGEIMEEHERRSRLYAAARLVFETMAPVPDG